MPILTFDSLDAVPEGLREVAKQDGEKVTVNVVPQNKLEEFRDKNIALMKDRDELTAKVGVYAPIIGEDHEAFVNELTELRATAQRVKDGQLTEGRKVEEEVHRRTEDMRKAQEEQIRQAQKEIGAWKSKAENLDGQYKRSMVNSAIKDAAIDPEAGVHPQAIADVINRAHAIWRATDDGKVAAYQGDLQLYGADGASPLTPKEWIAKLKEEAPYFFKGTGGGGAGGDGVSRNSVGKTTQEMKGMSARERLALANGDKPARL